MDKHLQNAKQPKNHKYMLSKPFKTLFSEKENWRVDSQLLVVGISVTHQNDNHSSGPVIREVSP